MRLIDEDKEWVCVSRFSNRKQLIDKDILRKCKDKNRLCVYTKVWNTCTDKPCEEGEKMTNREWLESLTEREMAEVLSLTCEHLSLDEIKSTIRGLFE